jgi:hypothetical protein
METRWPTIDEKAEKLIELKYVKLSVESTNAFYFDVRDIKDQYKVHEVMINKDTASKVPFSCTNCKYFEIKLKECSHILASRKYMRRAGLDV